MSSEMNSSEILLMGGVGCCLSAAGFYLLGRWMEKDADALKSVTRVSNLRDLPALLDTGGNILPLVVSISGRVGSDMPITCRHSGLRGVIVEEKTEKRFLKKNDTPPQLNSKKKRKTKGSLKKKKKNVADVWTRHSTLIDSMKKEVPWYLDDGTGHVYVVGARGATGFALNVECYTLKDSRRPDLREILDRLDRLEGLKMLGDKRTESVLHVGTPLTVIGEVVKDDLGTVRIKRPHKGPFYVSPKSIDQHIENRVYYARFLKVASKGITITVFSVCLLVACI